MSTPTPKSIALVDFFHMLTVNFKAPTDEGPTRAGQLTLDQLGAIRGATDHVVVCVDSKPYWRSAIYPDYKAGRTREPEFAAVVEWTLERLGAYGYNIARGPNQEADDVMATLAAEYTTGIEGVTEGLGCQDVRLVGADKDALQCLTEQVRCFVPKPRGEFEIRGLEWFAKEHTIEEKGKTFSITPSQFAMYLAICGDVSDHIPGVKGIGHVGAIKLIATYGTFEKMAEACIAAIEAAKVGGKLPAFWRNYNQGMAELPRWLRLTTLKNQCDLDAHPSKYLEKLAQRNLVQEDDDIERAAIQGEGELSDEVDWEAVEEKVTAEQERQALAAALPVEPAKPIIGADPNAAEILKQKAAERAARPVQEVINEAAAEARQRAAEGKVDESGRPKEKVDASGVAAETQGRSGNASAAAATACPPPAGVAAEVVPPTQGPAKQPPKPRAGDEITQSADIVRVAPPSWALAAQPATAGEMLSIAKVYMNCKMYAQFGTERGIFAVMALGRELGMGMAQSLEAFHIVKEKPFMKATALQALAAGDPDCVWILVTSSDDKHATTKSMHRTAGLLEYTYTIERAELAGLTTGANKDNWRTKRQEMLEARSKSKSSRLWYPRATFGMHSQEEAQDD